MKAIIQTHYGAPDLLQYSDVETPVPGDDEILVRVRAASVNPADWFFLTGSPWLIRLDAGLFRPKQPILGRDLAGTVEAVGKNVQRFSPGDAVYGENARAYAEYACVPEDGVARMPKNLSFAQAATVPLAGVTALQGIRDQGGVKPGHHVLVNGASGGVGTFAVQIAKAFGAEVTAVCSGRNADMVRSIGADHVVDYTRENFTETEVRYDAILDLVGSQPVSQCRGILTDEGVYICSVGRLGWVLKCGLLSLLHRGRVKVWEAKQSPAELAQLTELIESGQVAPVIDRRFSLAEAPEALRHQGEGHARGKSVIEL